MSSCDRDRRDPRGLRKTDKQSHAIEADGHGRLRRAKHRWPGPGRVASSVLCNPHRGGCRGAG